MRNHINIYIGMRRLIILAAVVLMPLMSQSQQLVNQQRPNAWNPQRMLAARDSALSPRMRSDSATMAWRQHRQQVNQQRPITRNPNSMSTMRETTSSSQMGSVSAVTAWRQHLQQVNTVASQARRPVRTMMSHPQMSQSRSNSGSADCGVVTLPFAETFTGYNGLYPECWGRVENSYGDPSCWDGYMYISGNSAAISPRISGPANTLNVSFAVLYYFVSATDTVKFGYVRDGESLADMVVLGNITSQGNYAFGLAGDTCTSDIHFVWSLVGGNEDYGFALDNVNIVRSSCQLAQNLVASYIGTDTIILGWNSNGATSWIVSDGDREMVVNDATCVFGGLQPATEYTFSVRSLCSNGDSSAFATYLTVHTNCEDVTLPFSENFDSYAEMSYPACWDRVTSLSGAPACVEGILAFTGGSVAISPRIIGPVNTLNVTFNVPDGYIEENDTMKFGYIRDGGSFTDMVVLENITTIGGHYAFGLASDTCTSGVRFVWSMVGGEEHVFYLDNVEIFHCEAVAMPYTENFDSYYDGSYPLCWERVTNSYGDPSCWDGILYLSGNSVAISPRIPGPVNTLQVVFDVLELYIEDTVNVGYIRDGGSMSDMVVLGNIVTNGHYSFNPVDDTCISDIRFVWSMLGGNEDYYFALDNVQIGHCEAVTLPYTENFDGYDNGSYPMCWDQVTNAYTYGESYPSCWGGRLYIIGNSTAISPYISGPTNTLQVAFNVPDLYYEETDTIKFGYIRDGGSSISDMVVLGDITSYGYYAFDLSADTCTSDIRFVWSMVGNGYSYFVLDNVQIFRCEAVSVPFTENFDDMVSDIIPGCWTKMGGGSVATVNSSTYSHSGSMTLAFSNGWSNIITLPQLTVPTNILELSLWTRPESYTNGYCGQFEVGYVTDLYDEESFVALATYDRYDFSGMEERVVNFEDAPASATIALRHRTNYSYWPWYVDDINVHQLPCPRPTIAPVNAIDAYSAEVQWTPALPDQNSFTVAYGTMNDITMMNTVTVNSTSITLNGLSPDTTYYVTVRANCSSEDTSSWTRIISFHTPCTFLIDSLPFIEDFENQTENYASQTFIPCWNRLTNNGREYYYYPYVYSSDYYNHTPNGYKGLYWELWNNDECGDYQCIVLPGIDTTVLPINTLQLSFWAMNDYSNPGDFEFYVGVMTNPNDITTFHAVDTISRFIDEIWTEVEVPFIGYTGNGNYVAVLVKRPLNTDDYYFQGGFDDFLLEVAPTCLRPKNVVMLENTSSTATINWTERGMASEWEVATMTSATDTPIGDSIVTAYPLTLTGLTNGTSYYFYVRSICGEDDTSEWSDALEFVPGSWNMRANMADTLRMCDGIIYSSGGVNGSYFSNENTIVYLLPDEPSNLVSVSGS